MNLFEAASGSAEFRLLHTMLSVNDLKASINFYKQMMGMRLLRTRDYVDHKFTLAFVGYGDESSNTVLELKHDWDQAEPRARSDATGHIAIGVPDVHSICKRLSTAGVEIVSSPSRNRPDGAEIAFVKDPDGFLIELIGLCPGSAPVRQI